MRARAHVCVKKLMPEYTTGHTCATCLSIPGFERKRAHLGVWLACVCVRVWLACVCMCVFLKCLVFPGGLLDQASYQT